MCRFQKVKEQKKKKKKKKKKKGHFQKQAKRNEKTEQVSLLILSISRICLSTDLFSSLYLFSFSSFPQA